ncbi:DNA repair protein RecO [Micavibrio aeruginosavorus]|uniref:DNA repair protein RecO n=1 Tax=Micavibrio aeruginosavorus (strain ARL-13) TaxID=856793 RepID=G2KLS5_MICAA|nr:DNA repair protein RecO [Micavibrio aeruginosavorus]AEP09304.1 DNA repair protein RecO [Micavibrio aeruginosavorus ARL-13]
MESWRDHGIVLAVRAHGEGGAVVSVLTETYGRHAGYVRGAGSSRLRGILEPGNLVQVEWRSRVADQLGSFAIEPERAITGPLLSDPLKLAALTSACALCDFALPEREAHPGLFHGLLALLDTMGNDDIWGAAYVMWEIAFMRELGFGLDFSRCVAGGDSNRLAYISPKSGRAVSVDAAAPYKEKLLPLPGFLKSPGLDGAGEAGMDDVLTGLKMNAYFLEHWVFVHHSRGLPEPRLILQDRFDRLGRAA